MNEPLTQIGRVALRREGMWWVGYYALPDTMQDAIELGRIRMTAAEENQSVKAGFISLMRVLVADIIEERTGVRPTWPNEPQPAPEHERAGQA